MHARAPLLLALLAFACHGTPAPAGPPRLVSLSPAVTETLFAIGAGDQVVGVSDFCDYPSEARQRTHAGSILQPNYESIARLRPTLILAEKALHSEPQRLESLAPTTVLPWLTLDDAVKSVREMGRLTDHATKANEIAESLRTGLASTAGPDAPRVLLVVAGEPGPLSETWYIKRDSLHGKALEAAGGRNAVAHDAPTPSLSLEALLALNPDAVVLLVAADQLDDATRQRYLDAWSALPLKAVKDKKVRVLAGSEVQSTGPRILTFTSRLKALIHELGSTP